MNGVGYGPSGQRLDVHRPEGAREGLPVVLLWHGRGPDERGVLAPLARLTASAGVLVLVPDWRSDAPDGGRAHLRESVAFARERAAEWGGDPGRVVLAGWSLGAKAALGVGLAAEGLDGWHPRAVVGIAGGYTRPAPSTGRAPIDELDGAAAAGHALPVWLVHGTADEIVDVAHTRHLNAALRQRGWPVALEELDADHAGVVLAAYDRGLGRCVPAGAARAVRAGARTAGVLARAAGVARGVRG
ncbi:alpha/beta hydrolase [Streptomyces sp. 3MP-14]|uniref:Alpha/beta hydrolase n=1 Tax=Streptomyces mimosae TaxID=2586635 RepID=A0A5N6AQF6_9ACTN|nr:MULTISPECIES: alpha/beta hydrolase [Streptomyces]KAB8170911.1 alpha/beta hydrolase [Streptomyces mimosae]KAB8179738.1 alpha/beta hydrolase [Streptomyces sp. 3MP-14]